MKKLSSRTSDYFAARLRRIEPDSRPRWGTMQPEKLMPHLRCMMEVSLGETKLPDYPVPLGKTFIMRWAVMYLPWPKSAKAPAEIFPAPEAGLDEERELLIGAMHRFANACATSPGRKTISPLLGPISLRTWARIHGRHLEHHLKQFGC